jgi:hypothetical protein
MFRVFETIAAASASADGISLWFGYTWRAPEGRNVDGQLIPTLKNDVQGLYAFEQGQRVAKPIHLWEVNILLPVVTLYAVARAYIIVEVLAGFRRAPAGMYKTFEVFEVLPHW